MSFTRAKKKKITAAAIVLTSEETMIGTLNRYIEIKLRLAKKQTKLDEEIAALNTAFDKDHQEERNELAVLESSVQLFAVNYRADLFTEDKKSKDYANATIGFRTTPASVGKLISKDTFEAIAMRLEDTEWGEQYVVRTVAPDKEALLRDRANLTPAQLQQAGIKFEQSENFYIDPTSDAIERSKIDVETIREVA
jgi:phage host-nuclease inhibitor protein Gam